MRQLKLVPLALLLIPVDAFACMNAMYRDVTVRIATQPLEFLHFGIFIAALVLLRWRGQPRDDEMWDPEVVLGEDEQLRKAERGPKSTKRRPEWSLARQFAFVAVALLGSFGIGLFAADALAITPTPLTSKAAWALGCLVLGLSTSLFRTGSRFLVVVRRLFLVVALLISFYGAKSVWHGELTRSTKVNGFESVDINSQVRF